MKAKGMRFDHLIYYVCSKKCKDGKWYYAGFTPNEYQAIAWAKKTIIFDDYDSSDDVKIEEMANPPDGIPYLPISIGGGIPESW